MAVTTLKSKIVLYFSGLALCLIILSGTLWRITVLRGYVGTANEQRTELLALAHELRRTSDELTRMAQTFVVTGDPTFKGYYQELIDIRDGKRPRPSSYDYLSGGATTKQQPDSNGQAIPLIDLIRRNSLTPDELALLSQIEEHSNHMNAVERRAIAVAERTRGSDIGQRIRADSAYVMLYQQSYYVAKTSLLRAIDEFISSVNKRTSIVADSGRSNIQTLSDFMLFMALFTLLYAIAGWWIFSRSIAQPLSILLSTVGQRSPTPPPENPKSRKGEIGTLATVYEDLLHKLAVGMQDLKRANEQLSQHSDEISKVNEALAARTSLLDATLSNISQGISVFDRDARLLIWNERFLELYHYDAAQVHVGMSLEQLIDTALDHNLPNASELRTQWIARIREMKPFMVEQQLHDGRVFEIHSTVTPEGLLVVTQTDISDRKAIERVKNEFVSTVSHELRTPLTSIAGSLGLLAGGKAGELPERAKKLIEIANNNSQRLVRLVNDILDLEKIDAGKMVFKVIPTSIRHVVEQAIESSKGYADSFHVRLRLAPDAQDGTVNGDPDRLTQVFINLLSNATKFSPLGANVDVQIVRMGETIRVSIRDYGRGIPPEFRSSIFKKFAQADASDRRERGGTGLGLNIAKSIVEHHAGHITFETEMGRGTTFIVELPLWQPAGSVKTTEIEQNNERAEPVFTERIVPPPFTGSVLNAQSLPEIAPTVSVSNEDKNVSDESDTNNTCPLPRILHVEDDVDIQSVVQESLEQTALVTPVGTVAAARAALASSSFDLVILDLKLPDGSGLELLPLRRNPDGVLTPIIIFSVEEPSLPPVLQMVTTLTKSRVSINELVYKVKSVLSHRQSASVIGNGTH
jgi:signal transduction histidine kinase